MSSFGDDLFVRFDIDRYVRQWNNAVQRQRDRVRAASDAETLAAEIHLYSVALNQLADIVKWAMRHAKDVGDHGLAGRLSKSMKDFKVAAPDYKDVRDIHEHIEDYEQGIGQLQVQRWGEGVSPGLARWWTGV